MTVPAFLWSYAWRWDGCLREDRFPEGFDGGAVDGFVAIELDVHFHAEIRAVFPYAADGAPLQLLAHQRFRNPCHADAFFQHFDDALAQAALIDGLEFAGRLFVKRKDDPVGEGEIAVGKVGQGGGARKAFHKGAPHDGEEAFPADGGGFDVRQEFAVRFILVQPVGEQHVHLMFHQGAEMLFHALRKGIDHKAELIARLPHPEEKIREHVDGEGRQADEADDAVGTVPGRELPPGFGHAVHDVAGHGQELFALRREADGEGRPVEQDHAEPLLQCPDAAAEGGLGDVALLRRM